MIETLARPTWDLRQNYQDLVEMVNKHDQVVIISNGACEMAVINMEIYAKFEDFLHRNFVYEELQKSKTKIKDPNTKRTDSASVFSSLKKKRKNRAI